MMDWVLELLLKLSAVSILFAIALCLFFGAIWVIIKIVKEIMKELES